MRQYETRPAQCTDSSPYKLGTFKYQLNLRDVLEMIKLILMPDYLEARSINRRAWIIL